MGQDSQWQRTGVDMEGKVPQCQDHRQERSQSNGSGGGWGWDGLGAGFLVCNLHFGLFERQTLGCTGCGGDVRLCHSQTCGVCVWRVGWGCERERERRETGGLRWSSSVGQKREGNERTSLAVQWLGCRTFTAGVKAGS